MTRRRIFGWIVLGAVGGLVGPASASLSQLKEGNRFFVHGHYDEALKVYNDALIDQPNSSILHYNAGDASYALGNFKKAADEFQTASQSAIPILKSTAHFNRGNAFFRQQQWADAIASYKDCLRVNPNDADAKYNLSVALRMQNSPPQKPPPSGQKNDKSDQKQGQSGDKKDQSDQQGGNQPKSGQMSREDAERLLAAAGADEKKKSNQKAQKSDTPHPDEDW